jgi:hypothetical protein
MANDIQLRLTFFSSQQTNNTAKSTETSTGTIPDNFTQSTSSRQPTHKLAGNSHSSLNAAISSIECDGSDFMSTATTRSVGGSGNSYSIIIAWTNADYTNDTWLISGTSNDAHWGIKAGGAAVIYKANGSKAAAAERDYATNSTANSTTSYTFGSDIEMVAIIMDATSGTTACDIYNINGDKIADAAAVNISGLSTAFPIDHIIGKSDGTKGLNGSLLDVVVCNGKVLTVPEIKGFSTFYQDCQDYVGDAGA